MRDHMYELVEKALKKLGVKSEIKKSGPAINFQIPSKERSFPEIDIDLVLYLQQNTWPASAKPLDPPALMDPGVSLVAKVLEAPENTKVWQITFSSSEILIFKDIDADGGCRKKLLKIAKYLKTKSDLPDTVASYHLKTLLLEMNERRKDPADWTEDKLVPRFKELMNGFLAALKAGILKSFFISKFNLFRGKLLSI